VIIDGKEEGAGEEEVEEDRQEGIRYGEKEAEEGQENEEVTCR